MDRGEYPSLWATIESIAPKIGCVPQTLNEWVRKHEVDTGTRDGVTSAERERVKELEREHRETYGALCKVLQSAPFGAEEMLIDAQHLRTSPARELRHPPLDVGLIR